MPIEFLFTLSALVVAPFWLLMIGLPGFRFTQVVLRSPWVLLPLPLLYTVLLVAHGDRFVYLVVDPTLHGLMQVLGSPAGALIAWVHVLAFDLFVGRWIYLDSQDRGVASLAVVPVLWLTLLVGPVGLLAYLVLRPLIQPAEEPTPPPVAGPRAENAINQGRLAIKAIKHKSHYRTLLGSPKPVGWRPVALT